MHVVKCPHCMKRFKVPSPVSGSRMKCSKCDQVFVGSSTESPDSHSSVGPPPLPDRSGADSQAGPTQPPGPRPARRHTSYTAVILLVCCTFAVLGIIIMLIATYYIRTHPKVIVRDAQTGRVVERKRAMTMTEAERKAERIRQAAAEQRRRARGLPPTNDQDDRTGPQPEATEGDPKLQVSRTLVRGGGVGETAYVCGRVLSAYAVPLKRVTVTAYIDGARGPSQTYQFVPAEGTIRYSICLGSGWIDEDGVKVVAKGEPADKDMIIWAIDSDRLERVPSGDKAIWTGRARNRSSTPVKDVKIYCDFFADDGIAAPGGARIGKLVDGETIGAGRSASFRVELDVVGADAYKPTAVRAVGRKY